MRTYEYTYYMFGKRTTECIEARSFKSAMKKLEFLFKDLPAFVTLLDGKGLYWKVRT